MQGFHCCVWLFQALYIIGLFYSIDISCAKISDLTPRVINNTAKRSPVYSRLNDSEYSLSVVKKAAKNLVDKSAETPLTTSLCATSVLLSAPIWLGWFPAEPSKSKSTGYLLGCTYSLAGALVIPEFNKTNAINLVSFYVLLREIEQRNGMQYLLKHITGNFIGISILSRNFGNPPDLYLLSRSITVSHAFSHPFQTVGLYGILLLKQWQLPLVLLLIDSLFTLKSGEFIEGAKATVAGAMTHVISKYV
ncbi:hypothetical protein BBOV_I001660 [Babesia bovis T2Bo]|uniref:Uncharacterized protein n=1 Tax=Babesia bovis TaxID=5865 RepID=A7AW22_BABBO|nr:hypothetical protein BBOV_I001660 [Babesia bovis T2Bo]EDO05250.1 hypothetical protein BBOV_I001660 [Babesia bovis T2Bo]|eukprot:XP_001608818.1 hypothetical protein [Babesia bovis T2Bo]